MSRRELSGTVWQAMGPLRWQAPGPKGHRQMVAPTLLLLAGLLLTWPWAELRSLDPGLWQMVPRSAALVSAALGIGLTLVALAALFRDLTGLLETHSVEIERLEGELQELQTSESRLRSIVLNTSDVMTV